MEIASMEKTVGLRLLRGVSVVLAPLAPCPVDTPLRVL